MNASPRFSLVIPARNEEDYLPRLFDTVDVARSNFRSGPEAVEVIVADNVSTDRTAEIARKRGARVVPVEKRLIAAVRNGGAGAARGEVLAFLDADSQMHSDTFNAIDLCLDAGKVVGGATGNVDLGSGPNVDPLAWGQAQTLIRWLGVRPKRALWGDVIVDTQSDTLGVRRSYGREA